MNVSTIENPRAMLTCLKFETQAILQRQETAVGHAYLALTSTPLPDSVHALTEAVAAARETQVVIADLDRSIQELR